MLTTEKLEAHVKLSEGFEEFPYKCPAGKLTIGYGFNIEDRGIPKRVADYWLGLELQSVYQELDMVIGMGQYDQVRQAVLIDMAFNLGVPRLRLFKKMFAALDAEDYEKAAEEMLDSRWAKQVKGRAVKLAEVMRTGVWP